MRTTRSDHPTDDAPGAERVALAPRLSDVVARDGRTWRDRRHELVPHYGRVWRDLALCHVMIALGVAAQLASAVASGPVGWITCPVAAAWIGWWLAALALFGHEAGHSNLAPTRKWNDRIGDWLVWSFFAQSVRRYRRSHWQHHLHLGGRGDTETSYASCLENPFLVRAATGLHALAVLGKYDDAKASPASAARASSAATSRERVLPVVRSAALHGAILVALVVAGAVSTAVAWLLATAVVFPFLGTVRQVLEHRPYGLGCGVDVGSLDEGAVNRMFGTGFGSRWLGAAGFNRHLLHHWDPGVSYSRFDDMEAFLMTTALAPRIDAARSSYRETWRRLRADARTS